eukprot:TRINITY_DN0_c13_g1_i3.p1 TRINITY_DN0_c13_g1~~TRINITY_DN0_c13_g1_i3.p1  ORF type:complete len:198 (+),score=-27.58 TRINITY_DN0_c13_g1_i3:354-947(+)
MTHLYQEFLVHVLQLQRTIPSTTQTIKITRSLVRAGDACCLCHCSARAAQDVQGHHRPVIASNFHVFCTQSLQEGYWIKDPAPIQQVKVSFVNGINQTNHSTNQERPCTTTHRIKKELSFLSIPPMSCPGKFPRVESNQAAGSTPCVPFRQFLQVSDLCPYFPRNPKTYDFSQCAERVKELSQSIVGIVYSQDQDGI